MCVCVLGFSKSGYIQYVHGHTTYVHALQALTEKQAVSCSPHMFVPETMNTVTSVPADSHTSVCFIGKIAIL